MSPTQTLSQIAAGATVENAEEQSRHVDACPACRAVVHQLEGTTTVASAGPPSATQVPGTTKAEGPGRLKPEAAIVSQYDTRRKFAFRLPA